MSGTVTSTTGLISGIDYSTLIKQLMAVEARPQTLLKAQMTKLTSKSDALKSVNEKLLLLQATSTTLMGSTSLFNTSTVSSSDSNIVTATAGITSTPGTYTLSVAKLASTQQTLSKGFSDSTASAVGAGTLTFENGPAGLTTDTSLATLNGGDGVARGKIRITDRAGNTAIVDLSRITTVNDVLDTINNTSGISVQASVDGDSFKLTDTSGATTTALKVENVSGSTTATSLGLTTDLDGVATTITGAKINTVGRNSQLALLNDGNGVKVGSGNDLTFSGALSFSVDISSAKSLGEVIDAINTAAGSTVASLNSTSTGIKIANSGTLTISGTSAKDLGIQVTGATSDVQGDRLQAGLNSKLLKNLKGGSGITLGSISITNRSNTTTAVDLTSARSVQDVLSAINNASAGVTASINDSGNGITITDTTGSTSRNLTITGAAATGLGIAQDVAATEIESGNLQLRYISEATVLNSLNGGSGVALGKFTVTDTAGSTATIDLSSGSAKTMQDVITSLNGAGLQITARINDNGDGILIQDTANGGGTITVAESGSTTAKDLGLLGSATTAGDDYNASFEKTVTVTNGETLQEVATKINNAGVGIRATILNDGTGLNPYRLSMTSTRSGQGGQFTFDDGALDLQASNLVNAQNAVVFYGSTNAAQSLAVTSTTNTLSNLITGSTVDLKGVSSGSVTLTIARDNAKLIETMDSFVESFNDVVTTMSEYDAYDADTEEAGVLLGDATLASVKNYIYTILNSTNAVTGTYKNMTQVGFTLDDDSLLEFDSDKFIEALSDDRDAVVKLFTYKETQTTTDTNGDTTTEITAASPGINFLEKLKGLTNSSTGIVSLRLTAIDEELDADQTRVDDMQDRLDSKEERLRLTYANLETTLAKLQTQSNALTSFINNNSTSSSSSS